MRDRKYILSENILKLLDKRGLTVKELANRVGVHRVTMGNYINQRNFPSHENLHKIAQALDVSIEELMDYGSSVEEEREFLRCFRRMKEIYKDKTLLLISPDTYRGYNLQTGKKIVLKAEEVD